MSINVRTYTTEKTQMKIHRQMLQHLCEKLNEAFLEDYYIRGTEYGDDCTEYRGFEIKRAKSFFNRKRLAEIIPEFMEFKIFNNGVKAIDIIKEHLEAFKKETGGIYKIKVYV